MFFFADFPSFFLYFLIGLEHLSVCSRVYLCLTFCCVFFTWEYWKKEEFHSSLSLG